VIAAVDERVPGGQVRLLRRLGVREGAYRDGSAHQLTQPDPAAVGDQRPGVPGARQDHLQAAAGRQHVFGEQLVGAVGEAGHAVQGGAAGQGPAPVLDGLLGDAGWQHPVAGDPESTAQHVARCGSSGT
jgi:hypothetical protein